MSAPTRRPSPAALRLAALLAAAAPLAAQTPAASPTESSSEVVELDPLVVEAFRRDYVAPATSTGLGFEADPFTVPINTTSIPMDILTDQQVNNVEDALRNVAGVSKFKQGNGGEEKFSIRGFDASQSLYKDGARINNAFNATNIATTETANIERYDVLKGPAAILYGQGEPGGVINYVTKKPRFDRPYAAAEFIAGSYDYTRTELDFAGPLRLRSASTDTPAPLAFRLVTSYEDSDSHRDHHFRERLLFAPSLAWRPSENTTFTAQYEYITDDYTQDRGQILDGNNVDGYAYSARLAPDQFFGIPGWNDQTNSEFHRAAFLADHRVSADTKIELIASASRTDKTLFDHGVRAIPASNSNYINAAGDVTIRPSAQGGEGASDTLVGRLHHQAETAALDHKLLFQADYERIDNDGLTYAVANTADITYNVNTGRYTGIPAGGFRLGAASPGVATDLHQYGLVAQDLISLGEQWHLLLGARYTHVENRGGGERHFDLSPRTGLVYHPRTDLSFHASWATGFNPTTATGFNPATGNGVGGSVLDPETSEQYELGVRKSFRDGALELNASVFDLRKKDVVATDPASLALPAAQQWSSTFGDTRTLGFEFQAIGKLSDALRLIAGYAYLDNELTAVDPTSASRPGNRLPGIPEHSGNIWGVYEFEHGASRGLGLGLGVFLQGDIFASTENRATYDGFAQFDGLVYYKRDRWKLQLNVKNITDEEYNLAQAITTTDAFAAVRVGTSTPRTFVASVAYEF